ncbi:MAG: hypothetical protein A3A33_01710 [Candidatus Yanofskybacteria bacterium RIFCSPLOWO2_01_FULL_49_25]|uniref:O-antigen ligase-related domain-containing protein n=1 Tax=Candidatus Yanofskybacteria bacterium RIFCSPLOWO2_01_FULL_49_25 TaxID=1802701 RepID=A0A1F8GXM2_9BACT|nr:MAG: hypothetical protein A3A33_01710 [Candidatus Yanofskybacteria bacterium RIFCSPLOWO2_01_FULL_49_25]
MAKQIQQAQSVQSTGLQAVIRWGIYATAFMPLIIFSNYLSPFHFGKVILFRPWIEILAVLYIALALKDRSFLPKRDILFWAVTAFMVAFGLATLTSFSKYQSLMGTLERMGGWFTFFHFWLFYVIAASVLKTRDEWLMFVKFSVFVSFLSTIYGFLQKTNLSFILGAGGRERIFGTIGNPALFAGYIIVNFFLGIALTLWERGMKRYLWGVITALNFIAIILTAVRGSVIGTLFAMPVLAFLFTVTGGVSKKTRNIFIIGSVILVAAGGLLIANHNSSFVRQNRYLSRLSDISFKTRLIQTRFWAWGAGIEGWKESPRTVLVGWGPENFNLPFSRHFNPKFFTGPGSETLYDRAHNMFVEILVTTGLIGFLTYIALFGTLFWMLYKIYLEAQFDQYKDTAMIIASGLVAYIIHNCFIFDTSANFLAFFIFMGFVHILYVTRRSGQPEMPVLSDGSPVPATLRYSLVTLASIIAIVSIYKTSILPSGANYATTRGVVASWAGDHKAAIAKFTDAVSYDTFGSYEIRHRYAQYVLENIDNMKAEDGLDKAAVLLSSIDAVSKNLSQYPLDYLPYLYISRSYILLGRGDPKSPYNDLALENTLKAVDIAPTFVRTYYEVAQAYLNKQDYPNAIASFKKAVDLNPDVALSWWYMGITQMESGDVAGGEATIKIATDKGYDYTTNGSDLNRLLSIYNKNKNYARLAEIYEKLVVQNPNDPQYHASLAVLYAQLGKIDQAVVEAKKAASLDPAKFEAEARKFVASLGRAW